MRKAAPLRMVTPPDISHLNEEPDKKIQSLHMILQMLFIRIRHNGQIQAISDCDDELEITT